MSRVMRIEVWRFPSEIEAVNHNVFSGIDTRRYVPEPPHCTMEPNGYWQEQYGYVTCSNCGEVWCFDCDGPKQHKWTCCPHCRAIIDYGEEE